MFAVPAAVLLSMESWYFQLFPKVMTLLFCCVSLSFIASEFIQQIYFGYVYPPLHYENVGTKELGVVSFVIGLSNLIFAFSAFAFSVCIVWLLARKLFAKLSRN